MSDTGRMTPPACGYADGEDRKKSIRNGTASRSRRQAELKILFDPGYMTKIDLDEIFQKRHAFFELDQNIFDPPGGWHVICFNILKKALCASGNCAFF